jgi:N-acetylneuraminic acid mutarotase
MEVGRAEHQGAVIDGKLYVFGGYVDRTYRPTARADVYDPATDTWSRIADLPVGITHSGVASDGRVIYFAGGYPAGTGGRSQVFATDDVFFYDPATDRYTDLPGLPARRGGGALALDGRTLHFFGGSDIDRKDVDDHWSLNLDALDAGWRSRAPLPLARNHLGAAAVGGKVYAVGGQQEQDDEATFRDEVDVYDPSTDTWTPVADLPSPKSHITSATVVRDGQILVLGGETDNNPTNTVSSYNPATNSWTSLTPLRGNRFSGVADNLNGGLIYNGGNNNGFRDTTWIGSYE